MISGFQVSWHELRYGLAQTVLLASAAIAGVVVPTVALAQGTATAPVSASVPASMSMAPAVRGTRILVAGGTGRNGSAIVAALEALGARPRVLARDLARARAQFAGERDWVQGDVTRPETLAAAVQGIDVIINAVATRLIDGPNGIEAVDLGGMRNLLAAAQAAGVKRMVLVSGATVGRNPLDWPAPLQKGMAIKRATEQALIASGLTYTILRPTAITPRPGNDWAIRIFPQADYRPGESRFGQRPALLPREAPPQPFSISVADLAEVAVVSAADPRAANRLFVVSHGEGRASTDWVAQLERMPRE